MLGQQLQLLPFLGLKQLFVLLQLGLVDVVSLHRLVDVLGVQARHLLRAVLDFQSAVFGFLRLLFDIMAAKLGGRFDLDLDAAGLVGPFGELLVQVLAMQIVDAADGFGDVVLRDIIFDELFHGIPNYEVITNIRQIIEQQMGSITGYE